MTEVEYIYCTSCGYEEFFVHVAYSRETASGKLWICPNCEKETSVVDEHD